MKLLLSGGISHEQATALNDLFVSHIDLNGIVLYVPVANEEPSEYERSFIRFSLFLKAYGIFDIRLCADLRNTVIEQSCAAVYFDGGNTYKLLKEIRESGFDKEIMRYLRQNNGFVYGSSAGSIIFGKDIEATTYEDENTVGFGDTRGLNLAKGYDICCHYGNDAETTEYKRKRIRQAGQPNGTIALPDECGIFIHDDTITFIGNGIVMFEREVDA